MKEPTDYEKIMGLSYDAAVEYLKSVNMSHLIDKEQSTDGFVVVALAKSIMDRESALKKTLKRIMSDVETQDNRATAEPIFNVMKRHDVDTPASIITSFFTNNGAEEYIRSGAAEGRWGPGDYYVYVSSGYDNPEWKAIRKLLLGEI